MRRFLFAFSMLGLLVAAGAATAGNLPADKLAAVNKAAASFVVMAKGSAENGKPPRQSDPQVKALLDTVFDTGGLAALAPIAFSDLNGINDWSLKINDVGIVYVFAGTGINDPSQLSNFTEKMRQKVGQNTIDYGPEMGRYLDSSLQVTQALLLSVMAEMSAKPDNFKSTQVQRGLTEIRGGVQESLNGVMTSFLTPGLDPAWMRERLPALAAIAPVAAKFLLASGRHELSETAQQVARSMSDATVKAALVQFAKTVGT
ncbi:MAG TPA: hypothetical protein VND87_00785 [Stellaceae bacterium]|nr:hypothetical protein [Stellaceae bacterium]